MLSAQLAHLYKTGPRIVNVLRAIWIAAIVWYELGTFTYHVSQCKWPDTKVESELQHVCSLAVVVSSYLLEQSSHCNQVAHRRVYCS